MAVIHRRLENKMSGSFDKHFDLLGTIHLAMGVLCAMGGIVLLVAMSLGGVALISLVVPVVDTPGLAVSSVLVLLILIAAVVVSTLSLVQIFAGWGLLKRRSWAPALALLVSFFHLFNVPLGTALAVWTGWALLSDDGKQSYRLLQG